MFKKLHYKVRGLPTPLAGLALGIASLGWCLENALPLAAKRLISLLNALLPLSEEEQIHEIKYLPTELVPQLEGGKNTIVDVLCTDVRGRKFCVDDFPDAVEQLTRFIEFIGSSPRGVIR